MASASVVLGIRLSLYDFRRIKVEDVNLNTKVEVFKLDTVSKMASLPKENLELVYCGNILDDEATLEACGIKYGVMIHVLKKKAKEIPKPTQTMAERDIQNLVMAFRAFPPSYRSSLQKLSRPDVLNNIILTTPGLSQDPVAISMIQDPELLVRMGDVDTVRRIVELHPSLAEAAGQIAAAAHEEAMTSTSNPSLATTSSGYSYSLDALSEDEEMDSSQSSDSQPVGARHAITAAHLASALASASGPNQGAMPESPGITTEMFSQAMQQAIASVVGPPSSREGSEPPAAMGPAQLTQQMQQMRELGLTDDAVNLAALQMAQGNLHAAVDLVFSGAIAPP